MKPIIQTFPLEGGRILTLASVRYSTMENPEMEAEYGKISIVTVGHSFKDPDDTTSPAELGQKIALGRAEKSPILHLIVQTKRVSKEFCNSVMKSLADEVSMNLEGFLPLGNGKSNKKQPRETKVESTRILDAGSPNKGTGVRDDKVRDRQLEKTNVKERHP